MACLQCRFDMSETLNEERTFGSKQAYLTINLPEAYQLREGNAGTWIIEDEGTRLSLSSLRKRTFGSSEGFKVCDGELMRSMTDQMLLDYIPREKQIAQLKYELVFCEDEKCTMINGQVEPVQQTDSTVEFVIKVDPQTDIDTK